MGANIIPRKVEGKQSIFMQPVILPFCHEPIGKIQIFPEQELII